MFRKLVTYFLMISMMIYLPSYADVDFNEEENYDQRMGICATEGMSTGIGVSMMGWGIAIIIGITILALVLHQSTGGTAHSPVSTTGGTSAPSAGVGSVI